MLVNMTLSLETYVLLLLSRMFYVKLVDNVVQIIYILNNVLSSCVCLVTQLYLTLCDLKDCSPPGSSVHGIFQARILEWVGSSCPINY